MTLVPRTDPATWTIDTLVTHARSANLVYFEVHNYVVARCKALNDEETDSAQIMVRIQKEMDQAIEAAPPHFRSIIRDEQNRALESVNQSLRSTALLAKTAVLRNKTMAGQVKVTTSNAKLRQATLMNDDALKEVDALAERLLAKRKRDAEQQETKRAKHEATESLAKEQTRTAELKKEIQVEKNRGWFARAQDAIKNATEWAEQKAADLLARDEDPAEEGDGGAGDGAACPPPGAAGPGGPA